MIDQAQTICYTPGVGDDLHSAMQAWGRQQAALMRETARFFMELDLTMAQFRALAVIKHAGRLTGRDLAARLHVTPGSLVPLCDRLENLGYLRRVPDQEDRRLTWFETTPRGQRLFHRLWNSGGRRVMEAIAELPPEDQRDLARLLGRISERVEAGPDRPAERPDARPSRPTAVPTA